MNSPNRAYRVELATPAHDAGLARLLEESAFEGSMHVSYRRRPSVIASLRRESQEALIYVLIDSADESVVGMGAVTIRSVWLQGKRRKLAYLSSLRITPAHQKAFLQIPQMYEAMYQSTKDRVDLYLTTIVSSNETVIRMFEKKRKSMPEYHFVSEIETYFLGSKRLAEAPQTQPNVRLNGAVADMDWFQSLGARFYGTPEACGYLIRPQWKQYHVTGYEGVYRLLAHLPTGLVGWPRFPPAGADATYLAAGIYAEDHEADILRLLRHQAKDVDFIMVAAKADSKLARQCQKLTPAVYRTRLYQVLFHNTDPMDLSDLIIDVAFL